MDRDSFKPSWWLRGGHSQTLWPVFARKVPLQTRTERMETPDGDFVKLDWVGQGGPIVVVLPGLQGDINSSYVRGLLRECERRNWRGVLLNYRGRGEPNRLAPSYHCGMTRDLHHLVHVLREREPQTHIGLVGFSVGANICMKWLGECGRNNASVPVTTAACVSAPFHLGVVARQIEKGFARIYQKHLLRSLHRDVERKMEVTDLGLNLTRRELRKLDTFFKFDDRISGPINGFAGAEDYYTKTAGRELLRHVDVPTLLVSAKNDPLVPAHLFPKKEEVSQKVTLEMMPQGGHLGFVSGRWPWSARYWIDTRVTDFIGKAFGVLPA